MLHHERTFSLHCKINDVRTESAFPLSSVLKASKYLKPSYMKLEREDRENALNTQCRHFIIIALINYVVMRVHVCFGCAY